MAKKEPLFVSDHDKLVSFSGRCQCLRLLDWMLLQGRGAMQWNGCCHQCNRMGTWKWRATSALDRNLINVWPWQRKSVPPGSGGEGMSAQRNCGDDDDFFNWGPKKEAFDKIGCFRNRKDCENWLYWMRTDYPLFYRANPCRRGL